MSDFGSIEGISGKNPLAQLHAKPSVSMEMTSPMENVKESAEITEMQKYEFKMEEAEHAFSLMMEVRAQIEQAYQNITP